MSKETVDYESHQVINDFINKTNHAAVIGVTRGWGMILSLRYTPPHTPTSLPVLPILPPFCQRQGDGEKGMEPSVDGGGGSGVGGGDGRKKSENPFWNPFSIRGPQAVITGVPEWRPVSENVSYPFLKWNLIWEAQRWRGQRICKLLSIPAVNGNFISVRWHSPLFTVDHLNGCLKRRWPLTPLSPLALCIVLPTRRFSFSFIQRRVKPFFSSFKHFNYILGLVGVFTLNLQGKQTSLSLWGSACLRSLIWLFQTPHQSVPLCKDRPFI